MKVILLRAVAGLLALAVLAGVGWVGRRTGRPLLTWLLTGAAAAALLLLILQGAILGSHWGFPGQLEAMEFTVLEHARRFADGEPVYPEPSAGFVALAYNPGLYLVLKPLLALATPSLAVLRAPAVLSVAALTVLLGWLVGGAARSWRWGLVGAALFVLATKSLDGYLSTGHGDAPMILCALTGALLLGRPGTRWAVSGSLLLAAAFWLKQPGGVIAVGAGIFLLLRDRWRSWPPLLLLLLLGPLAYASGPSLFGPDFFDTTFRVPASWADGGVAALGRFLSFALRWWAVPALAAGFAYVAAWRRGELRRDALLFLWPFAAITGLLGAADLGSNDNVFATFGVWSVAILAREAGRRLAPDAAADGARWAVAAIVLCAVFLAHDLRYWLPSRGATAARQDLDGRLRALDGPLYAPWITPPPGVERTAGAHWVALEDRVRGDGEAAFREPWIVELLEPVRAAPPPAYLLLPYRLEDDPILSWLAEAYVLEEDMGRRFDALRAIPHRFDIGPPRYLYRRLPPGAGEAPQAERPLPVNG